jgi:hypothetical protein
MKNKKAILPTLTTLTALAATLLFPGARAGEVLPDFSLQDVNPASPRANTMVSPRDYLLQVSGYYFGDAG